MRTFIDLDTTPVEEPCAQVGKEQYIPIARMEAALMLQEIKELIIKQFGLIHDGLNFTTASEPHDAGTCIYCRIYYDPDNESQVDQVFYLESNLPEHWSEERKKILNDYCKHRGFKYTRFHSDPSERQNS